MVVVYSKDFCPQCRFTKEKLEKRGIEFEEKDIYEHIDYIKKLGYSQAPVVVAGDDNHWSGFRPSQIEQLK